MEERRRDPRVERVEELLREYMRLAGTGQAPPVDEFLAGHAELEELLRPKLEAYTLLRADLARAPAVLQVEPLLVGTKIGRYRLLAEAGRGGMGVVWKAKDETLNEVVALKFLPDVLAKDRAALRILRDEAKVLLSLTHLNIVRVRTLETRGGHAFLVMEYLAGPSLYDVVEDRAAQGRQGLAPREILWVLEQVVPALEYAHREGVTHRDIKPANLMLDRPLAGALGEGGERLKLTDFGLAFVATSTMTQRTGFRPSGTLPYMAPEVLMGGKPTRSADVYSLGATLYALISSRPPFSHGELVTQILHKDPEPVDSGDEDIDRAVSTAMAKHPAERPASTAKLLALARGEISVEEARRGGPANETPPRMRSSTRRRLIAGGLAVSLVAVAAAIGLAARPDSFRNILERLGWREAKASEVDLTGPSASEAVPVALQLDVTPCADGRVYSRESIVSISGRVEHARASDVQVTLGSMVQTCRLSPDGRFSAQTIVPTGASQSVTVEAEGLAQPARFELVHDALAPRLSFSELQGALRTSSDRIDVRIEADEEHLVSLTVGERALSRRLDQGWEVTGLQLPAEGENRFTVVGKDCAGNESTLALLVLRDSTGPRLTAIRADLAGNEQPAASTEALRRTLEGGRELALALDFDEPLRSAEMAGTAFEVMEDHRSAAGRVLVPAMPGPWAPMWKAEDELGNASEGRGEFEITVPSKVPAGLEVVELTPGGGRWARKVRDPRSTITFILVDPGSFLMGSAETEGELDERPQHPATIAQPFFLSQREVTMGQWRTFAEETGFLTQAEKDGWGNGRNAGGKSERATGASWKNPVSIPEGMHTLDESHPVTQVSWNDARAYCDHYGYRLPTEVEWECAARAGRSGVHWWGDLIQWGEGKANFADQALARVFVGLTVVPFDDGFPFTAPTGAFDPHPWGFDDILGNVWEWCEDVYVERAYDGILQDPVSASVAWRVLRGGSWRSAPKDCRSARRGFDEPSQRLDSIGFRVALSPRDP